MATRRSARFSAATANGGGKGSSEVEDRRLENGGATRGVLAARMPADDRRGKGRDQKDWRHPRGDLPRGPDSDTRDML